MLIVRITVFETVMSDGHSEVNCAARWHPVVVGEYTHRHADKY